MSEYIRARPALGTVSRAALLSANAASSPQTLSQQLVANNPASSTGGFAMYAAIGAIGLVGFLLFRHFRNTSAPAPHEGT